MKSIANYKLMFYEFKQFGTFSRAELSNNVQVTTLYFTVWKNEKLTLTEKFFRQTNYLVISLVKPLLSQNFCQKCVRVNFRDFYTV